jgi:hypothetical protein
MKTELVMFFNGFEEILPLSIIITTPFPGFEWREAKEY